MLIFPGDDVLTSLQQCHEDFKTMSIDQIYNLIEKVGPGLLVDEEDTMKNTPTFRIKATRCGELKIAPIKTSNDEARYRVFLEFPQIFVNRLL